MSPLDFLINAKSSTTFKMHNFYTVASLVFLSSLAMLLMPCSSTSCNDTRPCGIRFEFTTEMHNLRKLKSCQDIYRQSCVCNQPMDVLYNEVPPYIFRSDKNETVGIIPGLIKLALQSCCFRANCTRINYLQPFTSTAEALSRIPAVTAFTPFVSHANAEIAMSSTYLMLMKTRGVSYLEIQDINYAYFSKFFSSVGSNWPLFCISLLLALDAGIIIWVLDCYNNADNFPRRFRTGVLEGFWWAFVSMTTVGYGDRTPKSLKARLFSIVWITIGISVCGVFTASLTTGMTESLSAEKISIEHRKVGVLNATRYELNIAMRERANVQVYISIKELKNALLKREIEGFLLDDLVLKYYLKELKSAIEDLYIRRNAFVNTETGYGMIFPYDKLHNATNAKWSSFLTGFFKQNQDNLDTLVELAVRELPGQLYTLTEESQNAEVASLFHFTSVYEMLLKFIGYATLVLVIIGYFAEKLLLMLRYLIAWRQDKWMNRIENSKEDFPEGDYGNMKMNKQTARTLLDRFKVAMKEIQNENSDIDYSEVTAMVEEKVFDIANDARTTKLVDKTSEETVLELNEVESQT